jgi:hypothetical protein
VETLHLSEATKRIAAPHVIMQLYARQLASSRRRERRELALLCSAFFFFFFARALSLSARMESPTNSGRSCARPARGHMGLELLISALY